MNNKAIIAMSGGVDSSVAAYLMKEKGFDCIGVTMKLYDRADAGAGCEKTCCALNDVEDARSVACRLQIPYYVFNFTEEFRDAVICRFITAYENGATPNPCIDCNRYIKFGRLFHRAKELGYDHIATGHYARIQYDGERYLLKKAADGAKDQSYVLYAMTQEQLAHTLFPLGELSKAETRKIAEGAGLLNAKKHDSQDICFVSDRDYAKFIEDYMGKKYEHGQFIGPDGAVLGEHGGIIRYTVGQRKGLGLALPKPMYVHSKRLESNSVLLCENSGLFSKSLDAENFNWISCDGIKTPARVKAKVRYRQTEQWATATQLSPDRVRVEFDEPQRAVTKGQAVVLYDGDTVVGGGTIM
jgi:tRNA-specific 2-thiouridylase